MSKTRESKKEGKKKPAKTLKERRAEKKQKRINKETGSAIKLG